MSTYTRNDLADDMAEKLKISATQSKRVVAFLLKRLTEVMVEDRKIEFRGFGIFVPVVRKVKIGRNPKKPEDGTYTIPARKVVRFRTGKELDSKLNSPA